MSFKTERFSNPKRPNPSPRCCFPICQVWSWRRRSPFLPCSTVFYREQAASFYFNPSTGFLCNVQIPHWWLSMAFAKRCHSPSEVFWKVAIASSRAIFFAPTCTNFTLDDYLYGSRSKDNRVKTLRSRKADKEGKSADAVSDALLSFTLGVRFWSRGEVQSQNFPHLLDVLGDGRGELSIHGLIATSDRGYRPMELLKSFVQHGIGVIMILPDHPIIYHSFVGKFYLTIGRGDDYFPNTT